MSLKPFCILLIAIALGACARRSKNGELVGMPSLKSLEKTYSKDFPLPKKLIGQNPIPKMKRIEWPQESIARDSARYYPFKDDLLFGVSEITNKEYCFFLSQNPDSAKVFGQWIDLKNNTELLKNNGGLAPAPGFDDFPARFVSFTGAVRYCAWFSSYINGIRTEYGLVPLPNFRLPMKEESELAADFLVAAALSERSAWTKTNSGGLPQKTKSSKPVFGIFDFYGNISEWRIDVSRFVRDDSRNGYRFEYEFSRGGGSFMEEGIGTLKPGGDKTAFYPETGFRICMTRLLKGPGRETSY